ncbi:aminotransferase class V-fold PLP-dependent enzyme [Homoserinibacter sp. YIM 151385]|uniref:aminotransferase class V-fold PLP-dependent enzyme n=1 Tax=Homoserinibacter sp. YIM 151385 TaxID=2985506 RepID=UPI0022F00FA8|nr:aminotransferase class V-fold PLP-dependent enzyme [Homoserinibacter sp. YIM 151385]WBU38420.1 aminotransferase class V-fold PLP-dependent enzyme [Homoserinibacter sp. YIM 151385]
MTTTTQLPAPTPSLAAAIGEFGDPRGYLAVASIGLPPASAVEAMTADLAAWARADRDPQGYDPVIARTREHYGRLVGVPVERIAIGSQTSVLASLVATSLPDGAEVLVVGSDFSSIVFPFQQRALAPGHGIRLRETSLERLADDLDDRTDLVVFSLVQSATGEIADVDAILEAAGRHDVRTFCDTTQAAGVLPVDADRFDVTVCHAYKWLCSPRGVAFLTGSERMLAELRPVQAGWYAGDEVWQSCYGPRQHLSADARRFDVSPAWQAWVGAEPAIRLLAGLDMAEVQGRTTALGDALCRGLGIPEQHQPIVTWPDADGDDLRALVAAGVRASGRAGRLRASFHLWNDERDVEQVLSALRRPAV